MPLTRESLGRVAVLGAGPCGVAAAVLLREEGLECAIIDPLPAGCFRSLVRLLKRKRIPYYFGGRMPPPRARYSTQVRMLRDTRVYLRDAVTISGRDLAGVFPGSPFAANLLRLLEEAERFGAQRVGRKPLGGGASWRARKQRSEVGGERFEERGTGNGELGMREVAER